MATAFVLTLTSKSFAKMPLFGNKFSPKKTPIRKSVSSLLSVKEENMFSGQKTVKLNLGEHEMTFENGEWATGDGASSHGGSYVANKKLRKKIQELQEENNMLKLKYTIMLNMLTETTAESHLQEREFDKLKKMNNK